jgi:Tol biopolymer transport system component
MVVTPAKSDTRRAKSGHSKLYAGAVKRLIPLALAALLVLSLRAEDDDAEAKWLLHYERHGIDKIARLTAAEHSTILLTIVDQMILYAKNGHVGRIYRRSGSNCNIWAHPALSHDGLRVAFVANGKTPHHCSIMIQDIPARTQRELIETEDDPGEISWSWDDTKLAFWDGLHGLSAVRLADGHTRLLPHDENERRLEFWVWYPMQWLHNNRDLVVEFDERVPTKNPGEYTEQPDLVLINRAGSRLIDQGSEPAVSPLGDQIAYYSRDGITTINADGTGRTVLAKPPRSPLFFREDVFGNLDWSPDASRLFFGTIVSEDRSDKLYLLDVKARRTHLFLAHTSIRIRGWR